MEKNYEKDNSMCIDSGTGIAEYSGGRSKTRN